MIEQKVGGLVKTVSSFRRSLCSCCSLQQLSDSRFSATGASEVRLKLLYPFVNEHMCFCVFYLLCDFFCPLTRVPLAACISCEQKSLPCAHSSVLISILSSSLLPPLPVTTGVCCWHFWQPEDKNHTSRCMLCHPTGREKVNRCCYLFIYLLPFFHSYTNTVLLHLTENLSEATHEEWTNAKVTLK